MSKKNKNTLFGEAKYAYLSKMISLKDPQSAKKSVSKLKKEFNNAKTKAKKLRIAKATQLAANRAMASTKRKHLSKKEKKEFREIGKMYDELAGNLFIKYDYKK